MICKDVAAATLKFDFDDEVHDARILSSRCGSYISHRGLIDDFQGH